MGSVNRPNHNFSQIPQVSIPRSGFNRSHGLKTTFDSGYLVPVFTDMVLPGDTFNLRMTAFARLATPQVPFMDNVYLDTFFIFVPMRLLQNNWEKLNGAQDNPDDSTDYLAPTMTSPGGGYDNQSIYDYMGLPTLVPGLVHNTYYLRAYNFIYNNLFRDQNLQDSVLENTDDGPDAVADYNLLRRGKRHDYFTSALPWPQKGPAVEIPLSGNAPITGKAPVHGIGVGGQTFPSTGATAYETGKAAGTSYTTGNMVNINVAGGVATSVYIQEDPANAGFPNIYTQFTGTANTAVADLSSVTAATINTLRQAFTVQQIYELDARGGTRYIEILKAHFGVTSPDARLQRPEYLGGGSTMINVNPIAQTSSTDATTPQGNLAAMGTAHLSGHGFTKSFVEHGVIIGLVNVRADMTYQQGLPRQYSYSSRFDWYWPTFANLGEQAILNKEIYAQGTANPTQDAAAFGYQERGAEWRYKPSQITGKFRSNDPQSLDNWHLAQDFTTLPVLDNNFIVENPPLERVLAVQDEPEFLFDAYFDLKCARPMPVYSVPGLSKL